MKKTLLIALAFVLATGCFKDDRNNFMVEDSISVAKLTQTASVHTGYVTIGIAKNGRGLTSATAKLSTASAEELAAINAAGETSWEAIPENLYKIDQPSLSWDKEEFVKNTTLSWDVEALAAHIGNKTNCVIPVKVSSSTSADIKEGRDIIVVNVTRTTVKVTKTELGYTIARKNVEPNAKGVTPTLKETISLDITFDYPINCVSMSFPVSIDNSKIAAYNQTQEEVFTQAPEGLITLLDDKVSLEEGATSASIRLVLDKSKLLDSNGKLKDFGNYVVPIAFSKEPQAVLNGKSFQAKALVFDNMITYIAVSRAGIGIKKVTRLWGQYSKEAAWYKDLSLGSGSDRTMTMDDDYIYIAQSSGTPRIMALNRSNGSFAKDLDVTPAKGNGCTFPISCVRMMPSETGKDVLLACSLKGDGDQHLYVYAYKNGTDKAPVQILDFLHDDAGNADDWRRYGDRFSVKGTWENGELWFATWSIDNRGKTLVFKIVNGAITNYTETAKAPVDYLIDGSSKAYIRDLAFYPGAEDVLVTRYDGAGIFHNTGQDVVNGWIGWDKTTDLPQYARCWGFNFFEFHEKNFIAYVLLEQENATQGRLVILNDDTTVPANFAQALIAQTEKREFPIQDESDFSAKSSVPAASTVGDCTVREINGTTYIAAIIQGCGLSLFQLQ